MKHPKESLFDTLRRVAQDVLNTRLLLLDNWPGDTATPPLIEHSLGPLRRLASSECPSPDLADQLVAGSVIDQRLLEAYRLTALARAAQLVGSGAAFLVAGDAEAAEERLLRARNVLHMVEILAAPR